MVKAFPLFHPFAFSSRGYSIERSPLTGKYKKKRFLRSQSRVDVISIAEKRDGEGVFARGDSHESFDTIVDV